MDKYDKNSVSIPQDYHDMSYLEWSDFIGNLLDNVHEHYVSEAEASDAPRVKYTEGYEIGYRAGMKDGLNTGYEKGYGDGTFNERGE